MSATADSGFRTNWGSVKTECGKYQKNIWTADKYKFRELAHFVQAELDQNYADIFLEIEIQVGMKFPDHALFKVQFDICFNLFFCS